jgi:hypothetical protein
MFDYNNDHSDTITKELLQAVPSPLSHISNQSHQPHDQWADFQIISDVPQTQSHEFIEDQLAKPLHFDFEQLLQKQLLQLQQENQDYIVDEIMHETPEASVAASVQLMETGTQSLRDLFTMPLDEAYILKQRAKEQCTKH